ncbi:MAG: hypothetical protein WEC75_00050 [Dehalococcoidia bacterium]
MDQTWVLIDPNSGLHVAWYFWLRVLDEVNRSARYGPPFALLLLEAEIPSGGSLRLAEEAVSRLPRVIRSTDLGGVLGVGRAGIVLPHQDVAGAELARTRILDGLREVGPAGVRWAPRLLCYPGDGAEISNLLTSGWADRPQSEREIGRPA